MGDAGDPRQGDSVYRPIVAFDFDGTLTDEGQLRRLPGMARGPVSAIRPGLVKLLPELIAYPFAIATEGG